jgi:hypothetical protein
MISFVSKKYKIIEIASVCSNQHCTNNEQIKD